MSELIVQENKEISMPERMMELAITKGADVDNLSKLMDLQERWEQKEAKKAFSHALATFQEKCPVITKTKQGHNYKYAPLSSIVDQIKLILSGCGLSYRFEQKHDGGNISVSCIVGHLAGHSEQTTMDAEADNTGSKNAVQAIGSTVQYLMRYTLIGSLGIVTADQDDDAARAREVNIQDLLSHYETVRALFVSISAIKLGIEQGDEEGTYQAAEAWFELDDQEKQILWKAPSKGGIFTTQEREKIKYSGFRKAYYK